jgi:hypothetical protein
MANPFSKAAHKSRESKAKAMGKENNLVIPVMRAVGENRKGGISESSASMQHRDQAAAPGFKRGGGVDKPVELGMKLTAGSRSGLGRLQKVRAAAANR